MQDKIIKKEKDFTLLDNGKKILQTKNGFRFSEDAVLLANFINSNIDKPSNILEIGTGNGIIPILLSENKNIKEIVAVDIQKLNAEIALENIRLNSLEDFISVVCIDIKEYIKEYKKGNYFDCVFSNPPYQKVDGKLLNTDEHKTISRHEIYLNLNELIQTAKRVLKPIGTFYFIHMASRIDEIMRTLAEYKFSIERLQFIHYSIEKEANLVLIKAVKGKKKTLTIDRPLILK